MSRIGKHITSTVLTRNNMNVMSQKCYVEMKKMQLLRKLNRQLAALDATDLTITRSMLDVYAGCVQVERMFVKKPH